MTKKACWIGLFFSLVFSGCTASEIEPKSTATPEQSAPHPFKDSKTINIVDVSTSTPEHVRRLQAVPAAPPVSMSEPQARKKNRSVAVKGIYVSAWKAANSQSLDQLIKLVNETELNAMVVDVKNDSGQITYDSGVALADRIGADSATPIRDMKGLLLRLKANNIYTIARVVAFKDPILSRVRQDMAIQTKAGDIWHDKKGIAWVDPYHPDVQAYNIAIAKEAAALGFDEIQFDYVRFPENGAKLNQEAKLRNPNNISKSELIRSFLHKAKTTIPNVPISADVFGLTPSIKGDMGIGQEWNRLSPVVDIMSPMVYPSHYNDGALGIAHPDLQPYAVVKRAMQDALKKNRQLEAQQQSAARVRPWLQDFTAKWVRNHQTYGAKQVREQIQAAKDLGVDQYLLWNPSCRYTYRDS